MCEFWTPRSAASCGQPDFKPIVPMPTDGWGYRNMSAGSTKNNPFIYSDIVKEEIAKRRNAGK